MAGGYSSRPGGLPEILNRQFRAIWEAIDALRVANKLESAIVGAGGIIIEKLGSLLIRGGGGIDVNDGGSVRLNGGGGLEVNDGGFVDVNDGGELNVRGTFRTRDATTGNGTALVGKLLPSDVYRSGLLINDPVNAEALMWIAKMANNTSEMATGSGLERITLRANGYLSLDASQVRIYQLPTTSSAANLRLNITSGGTPLLTYIASSRRYKQDVADAEVDPDDVLAMRARTWRDKGEVEADPDITKRAVGFIAEELDEHPSLRQFVDYDAEGRPDAIQYDRLSVAVLALAQRQQQQLDDQRSQIDALTARLDALEQDAP